LKLDILTRAFGSVYLSWGLTILLDPHGGAAVCGWSIQNPGPVEAGIQNPESSSKPGIQKSQDYPESWILVVLVIPYLHLNHDLS